MSATDATRSPRERVIRFGGPGAGLAGVVTDPSERAEGADREAVILLNSGILHRVGACRLHVKLARRLAAQGLASLRFDHSGIGDSEARRDSLAFEESAPREVAEALDWFGEKRGIQRFVLFGLCSGADMAFASACRDPRVTGLVLLDPWAYRTARHWWVHYRSRVTSLSAWRRWLKRRRSNPADPGQAAAADPELDLPTYVRQFPPREQAAADLATLMSRGVRMLCVFSGGQLDDYNHAGQMRASFAGIDFGDRLEEVFRPEADHIFTDLAEQRLLLETVERWLGGSATVPVAAAGGALGAAEGSETGASRDAQPTVARASEVTGASPAAGS